MAMPKLSFREELREVKELLYSYTDSKEAGFKDLVPLAEDELDDNLCPAIIIAVSKACGYTGKKAITLAAIMQYIYMADKVHNFMQDNEGLADELRQFPVLVGDFLFGKFFWGLSQANLLNYLAPLAGVIVSMSKGAVNRWLAGEQSLEVKEQLKMLANGTASLTGLAARIGSELAAVSPPIQQKCEMLGRLWGLAWTARNERLVGPQVLEVLDRASSIIDQISKNLIGEQLREVHNFIRLYLPPFYKDLYIKNL
jgi:geranylgeranyl pyrophosphate synthase